MTPAPVPFLARAGAPALVVRNAPCRDCGRPWYQGPTITGAHVTCCARGSRIFRTAVRVARWLERGHAREHFGQPSEPRRFFNAAQVRP